MTTNPLSTDAAGSVPQLVTLDRVTAALEELGIAAETDRSGRAAAAELSGFSLLFVLLDTVLIARTDTKTDLPADSTDAAIYLAANQVNSSYLDAHAVVVNRGENLVVRTEAEISVPAGLTDEQLTASLKAAVDGIVECQAAMRALTEQLDELRED